MSKVQDSALWENNDAINGDVPDGAAWNQNMKVFQAAINDNQSQITTNTASIATNTTAIATANSNISTLQTNVANNTTDIGNMKASQVIQSGANFPANPSNGQMFYLTGSNQVFMWNGSKWISIDSISDAFLTPYLAELFNFNGTYNSTSALQGSRGDWATFARASTATGISQFRSYSSGQPRWEPSQFGNGIFIEEGTTNLVENSDFETVTTTATLFSDALTSYTGATVPAPWTLQSGSFTFGASGATSGANGSLITAGNAQWKPVLGSDGSTQLLLKAQATFTEPSTVPSGVGFNITLSVSPTKFYRFIGSGGNVWLQTATSNLTGFSQTLTGGATYTATLSIDSSGNLTAKLYSGTSATGTPLQTLTATDTSLTGGFLIGVGGDTGVVISNASVTGPWANGWSIGGDSRVAWALSQNVISGKYSVCAVGVHGVNGYCSQTPTVSASVPYTISGYINASNVGTSSASIYAYVNGTHISASVTGTQSTERISATGVSGASGGNTVCCEMSDSGTVTFDSIQLEQKAYATSYLRNDSTSGSATRAAETCTIPATLLNASQGAKSRWAYEDGNTANTAYLTDATNHAISIYKTGGKYYVTWNGAQLMTVNQSAKGLHLYTLVWNGTSVTFYIDGASVATATAPAALNLTGVTNIYVGSKSDGTSQWNNVLSGLMVFNQAINATQVSDLYALPQPAMDAFFTVVLPAGLMTTNDKTIRSAVSVYASANQTLTASTWTKVKLNTEEFDNQSEFDSTTNYRFTSKNGGIYIVSESIGINGTSSGNYWMTSIYKNGSEFRRLRDINDSVSGSSESDSGTCIIELNAGDYIELWMYTTASSMTIQGTEAQTWMSVVQVA